MHESRIRIIDMLPAALAGGAGYAAVRWGGEIVAAVERLAPHAHVASAASSYWPLIFEIALPAAAIVLIVAAWGALAAERARALLHRREGFGADDLAEIELMVADARRRAGLPV